MTTPALSAAAAATLLSLKRARFVPVLYFPDDDITLTAAQWAKRKPTVRLEDLNWAESDDLTKDDIAKLAKLLKTPIRYAVDGYDIEAGDAKRAKKLSTLTFRHADYGTCRLSTDGTLKVGCQTHTLDEWEEATDYNLANYFATGWVAPSVEQQQRRADRDAILPVLRRKLAAYQKAHPKTKKAKKRTTKKRATKRAA